MNFYSIFTIFIAKFGQFIAENMANGDSTLLLVEELFSGPWRDVMDAVFYFGAVYGAYKMAQVIVTAVKGFRTYFIPLGRAVNNLERYGQWAGRLCNC